jgi:serine protease inhibitor
MPDSLSKSTTLLAWSMIIELCAKGTPPNGATISPLSVGFALGMLAGGADINKRKELCSMLGIENADELNTVFHSLLEIFSTGSNNEALSIANGVFSDQTFTIAPKYVEHVESFHAYIKGDFPTLKEGTDTINDWISQKTKGMIKNMLGPKDLETAHVALVNALAFRGIWKNKFDPRFTSKNYPFQVTDDKTRPTDMMFLEGPEILLHNGEGYTAIRLPYAASSNSSRMSFIAYLPNKNISLQQVIQKLRDQGIPRFSPTKLTRLGFPRLNIKTAVEVFDMLQQLGYPLSGNYPEMGNGPNQVQKILHNAAINVDEHGTEAAAATVVIMTRGLNLNLPPSVIFDRPFAFSIVVEATELVVFAGVFTVE